MIPTVVPLAAFSATVLAAALVSVTAPTSNSSTSINGDREGLIGERTVGRSRSNGDVPASAVRFAIDGPGDGHDACIGIDRESTTVVVLQAIRNRIRRRIRVAGEGR